MGTKLVIWSAIAVVLFVFFIVIRTINKKKKHRREELEQIATVKLREEALDRMILNEKAQNEPLRAASEQPYHEKYSASVNTDVSKQEVQTESKLMLQVEETSIFSKRSYMLDPEHVISVGAGKDNTISLPSTNISTRQCEICTIWDDKEMVVVRNVGLPDGVVLIRKKESIKIGSDYRQLIDGDVLKMVDVQLKLNFVKVKRGNKQ